jgi:hypothetical protein
MSNYEHHPNPLIAWACLSALILAGAGARGRGWLVMSKAALRGH